MVDNLWESEICVLGLLTQTECVAELWFPLYKVAD